MLVIPVVTMRLIAEEKATGTLEMLITLPVKDWEVVVGKYLGALSLVLVLVASTALYPIAMFIFPWKLGSIDWGPVRAGYLGLGLLSSAGVAIGLLISSVTRSQVIAFFVTWVVLFALTFLNLLGDVLNKPGVGIVLNYIGFQSHLNNFARGLIDTRSIVYFVSITVFALMVSFRALESRKWK
jgi:ABC-2 type transport system permease protein